MSKKELNIYYKGSKQKIKYYDSINEEQIKKTVKQIFKINEPLEQIFFQDEDGDILILNEHIPSGLSIYIFVEPDSIPKNPSKELKVENKPAPIKFHWILEKELLNADKLPDVIENKYAVNLEKIFIYNFKGKKYPIFLSHSIHYFYIIKHIIEFIIFFGEK